jgi:hypothetical protein
MIKTRKEYNIFKKFISKWRLATIEALETRVREEEDEMEESED